jgi:DNA polymerase III delta prime subunit
MKTAYELEQALAEYFADPEDMSPDLAKAIGLIQARLQEDADKQLRQAAESFTDWLYNRKREVG